MKSMVIYSSLREIQKQVAGLLLACYQQASMCVHERTCHPI